jgi:2,4-dienoyl-CoA reductase-like NADH-dependent reductase (Old Yellow Enzyme family)
VGLWEDAQVAPIKRIADVVHEAGASFAIQLAHAGSKAAGLPPWVDEGGRPVGGSWEIRSVTDAPYLPGWQAPVALGVDELPGLAAAFAAAAERAERAGADVVELHMAHGYLLHSFLSPLGNNRDDGYGGSLTGRMRFPLEVVEAVRAAWPQDKPLLVRIAAVDNGHDGITIEQSVAFSVELKRLGVDMVDCSSGGYGGAYQHGGGPGYQVAWAREVRARAHVPTVAVGMISDPHLADSIVSEGAADLVALGREALANPAWPHLARETLQQYTEADRFDSYPLQSRSWLIKRERQRARLTAAEANEDGQS